MKTSVFNKSIEQKIHKFIKEYNLINSGDRILLALSGGADSVFLLNYLFKYKNKYKIDLATFHLNHLLRKESVLDQKFSEKISSQLRIRFFAIRKNVRLFAKKNKMSIEEAGRIIRYKYLHLIAKKYSFNKIATAHNLDDNAETVLLNLIKGKGLRAISGIPISHENIIRPIMCLTKSECKKYNELNNLSFIEDLSNQSEAFERNFLRLKIVPQLVKSLNKNLSKTVFQTSKILEDYLKYFNIILSEKYNQILSFDKSDVLVNLLSFKEENKIIKTEIIRRIILQELKIEPTFRNINEILRLVNFQSGKRIKISEKYEVIKEKDFLRFSKIVKKKPVNVKIKVGKTYSIYQKKISVKKTKDFILIKDSKVEIIDSDKVAGELIIRNWQDGDKFYPLGMKGSKKISDFLNDLKISVINKKDVLVLSDDEKIVCVLGYRIDDRVKVSKNSKNFYKIEIKNGK